MICRVLVVLAAMAIVAAGERAWGAEVRAHRPATAPAADHLEDLRSWIELGLPLAAEWNVRGYTFAYHVHQVRSGHRFLPSVYLPTVDDSGANPNRPETLFRELSRYGADWAYLREHRLPLCLRSNNISQPFVGQRYRLAKVEQSIARSPLVWSRRAGGVLEDERLADVFASPEQWANEGRLWGRSQYVRQLQRLLPEPPYLVWIENNEGPYDRLDRYVVADGQRRDAFGLPVTRFRSPEELDALSLRLADHVRQKLREKPDFAPADFEVEYWSRRKAHYQALYSAFEEQLEEGWKGRIRRVGYSGMSDAMLARPPRYFEQLGYAPALTYFDTGSPSLYVAGRSALTDFTSTAHLRVLNLIPAWREARKRNPRAYRELSLYITDGGVLAGVTAGRHELMTPKRYSAWVQWLLWATHEPGTPSLLRRWCPARENYRTPLFAAEHHAKLVELGAAELRTATSETYLKSIIEAVDVICADPTLRRFWLKGKPIVVPGPGHPDLGGLRMNQRVYPRKEDPDERWVLLECSANPPRHTWKDLESVRIKVWAVGIAERGRVLVYAWSPCKLEGRITIDVPGKGPIEVDAPQPSGYWIVE